MNFLLASHSIGRIFGIELRIAYSLYFVVGFMALGYAADNPYMLIPIALIPVFVLLHELGHSLVSLSLGVNVRRITLHMLGGAAEISGLIPGPKAEILIAIAGPAVSIVLSIISFTLFGFAGKGIAAYILWFAGYSNLFLALFNMLPIFPMDGGRVALATAILFKGEEKGIRLLKPFSLIGVFFLVAYGCWLLWSGYSNGVIVILIGIFLYYKGSQELQARQYAARYSSGQDRWMDRHDGFYRSDGRDVYSGEKREPGFFERWSTGRREKREQKEKAAQDELNLRVDEVLAKVKREGIASLTPGEKALLNAASEEYRKR